MNPLPAFTDEFQNTLAKSDAALELACLSEDWAELYRRAAGEAAQEMLSADTVCEAMEPWLLVYARVGELYFYACRARASRWPEAEARLLAEATGGQLLGYISQCAPDWVEGIAAAVDRFDAEQDYHGLLFIAQTHRALAESLARRCVGSPAALVGCRAFGLGEGVLPTA